MTCISPGPFHTRKVTLAMITARHVSVQQNAPSSSSQVMCLNMRPSRDTTPNLCHRAPLGVLPLHPPLPYLPLVPLLFCTMQPAAVTTLPAFMVCIQPAATPLHPQPTTSPTTWHQRPCTSTTTLPHSLRFFASFYTPSPYTLPPATPSF